MKHLFVVSLLLLVGFSSCNAALAGCNNQCLAGAVPCQDLPRYLSQSQLNTDIREWGPYKGSINVVGPKAILVTFRFDQAAINIFKTRSDFALEFDVVDKDRILGKPKGSWTFAHTLKGMSVFRDTPFMDEEWQLSLVAIHPEVLEAEKDYKVYFYTENPISRSGQIKLNISLSVDFEGSASGGLLCDNPRYSSQNPFEPWNYFTLEIDQFREFQYVPNASNLGICWVNHDDSGPQYCGESALPVTMCAWTSSGNRVCWKTKNGEDRSCENATAWYTSNPVTKTSGPTNASICPSACYTGPNMSSILDFLIQPAYAGGTLSSCAKRETGEDYVFGTSSPGSGSATPATDSPQSGKPDFVGKSIRLYDTSGRERYSFKKTDTIRMVGKLSNNGSANIPSGKTVKSMFLLSKGYKEDPHGEWKKVGTEEMSNLVKCLQTSLLLLKKA